MVPHHQTAALTSTGLEVIVLGKINWCHFQQIDQDSWYNNKPIVFMRVNAVKYIYTCSINNNIIYVEVFAILQFLIKSQLTKVDKRRMIIKVSICLAILIMS